MMFRKVMIFLLAVVFAGCSQQAGEVGEGDTSSPRVITRVRSLWIEPANPTSNTDLRAEADVRGDPKARLSYQWLKNNVPIPGAIRETLPKEQFSKGDLLSVQARVMQPGGDKDPVTSDAVLIGNTPPVVDWVAIGPAAPTSATDLNAVAKGRDLDNEELTFSYQWVVNGEQVVGQEGPSLASGHFGRGAQVHVRAIPFDGSEWGQPGSSIKVTIQNSPPKIVSNPPKQLQEGATYRYEVKVVDVDGDTLRFYLQGKPPEGMVIDAKTGVVEWQVVVPEKPTTYEYEVVVEDAEGAKSIQKITLKTAS